MSVNRYAQRSKSLEQRFWEKVLKGEDNQCWEWQAYVCPSTGYGRFGVGHPKVVGAHRHSYEMHHGEIPDGLVVMHDCDNRKCVNPNHLSIGTHQENLADMMNKGRSSAGERCGTAKLTEEQVVELRRVYAAGAFAKDVANQFGISRAQVTGIVTGKFWAHAAGPITHRRRKKLHKTI